MGKILLDYFFKIASIVATPAASTAFLKQVCVVAKPKDGVEPGSVTLCTSSAAVAALTDNTDIQSLLNAGMSRVYVLLSDDLNLVSLMEAHASKFFTLLVSSDFDEDDVIATAASGEIVITSYANLIDAGFDEITVGDVVFVAQAGAATLGTATFQAATSDEATAASLAAQINAHDDLENLVLATVVGDTVTVTALEEGYAGNEIALAYSDEGTATIGATVSGANLEGGDGLSYGIFKGVIGVSSDDLEFLEDQAVIENRCAFHTTTSTKAKNMFFAFGKMLSNSLSWKNQQYITTPNTDDVDELGEAENFFDLKISFSLSDDEYGQRLGLFACGGKPIVSPYIRRNYEIDLQSAALSYVSANQPEYTYKHASLIEDELQKVSDSYVDRGLLKTATAEVKLEQADFVASAYFDVADAGALWRFNGQITQS